jgi:hypothetical protein
VLINGGLSLKYGIIKLKDDGIISYNLDSFNEGEEVIALPVEELQSEILRLKYYLEKSSDKAENIIKGRTRYKKTEISKIGDELTRARATVDSITKFQLQTSLDDFNWPELRVRKKKRLIISSGDIKSLADIKEGPN